MSVRTIQNYETGRSIPYRHLEALSSLLQRRTSWLLYGDERPDADRLLARSRQQLAASREQRSQLRQNTERLRQLSQQLVDSTRTTAAEPQPSE